MAGPSSTLGVSDLVRGGIDRADCARRATIKNNLGNCTGPAANIEPAQAVWQRQPVEEYLARDTAPSPNISFVRLTVCEMAICFGHVAPYHALLSKYYAAVKGESICAECRFWVICGSQ